MTKTYLAVFEGNADNWDGFMPDIRGTGGLGSTLDEARESLLEGVRQMFEYYVEEHQSIPEAVTTNVDFAEFSDNPSSTQYVVQWLTVTVPQLESHQRAA
jgi:predicted RNase H-like HicB family nuclease